MLSPGHPGVTRADTDSVPQGAGSRKRGPACEPAGSLLRRILAVSLGHKILSTDGQVQEAFHQRLLKRQSKTKWQALQEVEGDIGNQVRNHQNNLQRKLLLEKSVTEKFSVTVHCWDIREPWALGTTSFLKSSSSPLCSRISFLWFTGSYWEITLDIFQSPEGVSHVREECWEAGKRM